MAWCAFYHSHFVMKRGRQVSWSSDPQQDRNNKFDAMPNPISPEDFGEGRRGESSQFQYAERTLSTSSAEFSVKQLGLSWKYRANNAGNDNGNDHGEDDDNDDVDYTFTVVFFGRGNPRRLLIVYIDEINVFKQRQLSKRYRRRPSNDMRIEEAFDRVHSCLAEWLVAFGVLDGCRQYAED